MWRLALPLVLLCCDPGPVQRDCQVRCGPQRECPASLACSPENFCRPQGAIGLCGCYPGETERCGNDTGECVAGTRTCGANRIWGSCEGAVPGTAERCDGLDNDCDGLVDQWPPQLLAVDTNAFHTASMANGTAVIWEQSSVGGGSYAVVAQVYDESLQALTPTEVVDVLAVPPDRLTVAAHGRSAWFIYQGPFGASDSRGKALSLDASGLTLIPGLPRPEATGLLSAVGTAAGLLAAWPINPRTVGVGRWPLDGGLVISTHAVPFGNVTQIDSVFVSSGGTAVGFEASGPTAAVSGLIDLAAARSSDGPVHDPLIDVSGNTLMTFWCGNNPATGDSALWGRTDVFDPAPETVLRTARGVDQIGLCRAQGTPRDPLLGWVESSQLYLAVPGAGATISRVRPVELDGGRPTGFSLSSSGGESSAVFFLEDNHELRGVRVCTP